MVCLVKNKKFYLFVRMSVSLVYVTGNPEKCNLIPKI